VSRKIAVKNRLAVEKIEGFLLLPAGHIRGLPVPAAAQTAVEIAGDPVEFRRLFEQPHLSREPLRQPFIIRIKEGNPFTRSGQNARVSSSAGTLVFLMETAQPGTVFLNNLAGAVGRAVINDDNFLRRQSLPQYTVNRSPKNILGLISRNNNANTSDSPGAGICD